MRKFTRGDFGDMKVLRIYRAFVLGTGGGVRIEFVASNQMLGKALNVDLNDTVIVLLPFG